MLKGLSAAKIITEKGLECSCGLVHCAARCADDLVPFLEQLCFVQGVSERFMKCGGGHLQARQVPDETLLKEVDAVVRKACSTAAEK